MGRVLDLSYALLDMGGTYVAYDLPVFGARVAFASYGRK